MPVLDGLAAAQRMRERAELAHLPILALTANAFDEDKAACVAAGMNDFIGKPVHPEHFYQCLLRWLPGADQATFAAEAAASLLAQPPWLQRLASLAGLDTQLGLRMVQGKHTLYREVLELFVQNHAADGPALHQAAAAADLATLQRLAHGLKGVAGTMGAQALLAHATRLATAARSNGASSGVDTEVCVALARALGEELRHLVQGLQAVLNEGAAP
jgi:HPt (histidine-containing phosphotransfer) domain-containing protein